LKIDLTYVNKERRRWRKRLSEHNKIYQEGDVVWYKGETYIGPVKIIEYDPDIVGYYVRAPFGFDFPVIKGGSLSDIEK
jgi:hypothetical protein